MQLIDCTHDAHAGAILAIINDVILTSTALYDYAPRPLESMKPWFEDKRQKDFPVLGVRDERGELLGFGSYGAFRPFPANKYTVEHSVYVRRDKHRLGLGKLLLGSLIERASQAQLRVMVGVIDLDNSASIGLHSSLGFAHVGTLQHAAFKFERWLDVAFFQRTLPGPVQPTEG